jgi:acetyl esterase/lipase
VLTFSVLSAVSAPIAAAQNQGKPAPTHANVAYGPHEQNVLDVWLAKSDTPTPLVAFIHGGGFRAGSKNSVSAETLRELLEAGISVAAIEYRFISQERLPAAHFDCRRALQFLRSKAEAWNIDKTRVGAFGGSAGAQLCMWLAFHDEMADPQAAVPTDATKAQGWKVHHVIFGVKLKEKMDALGIEADLKYPGASSTYSSVADFFKAKFGKVTSRE